MSRRLAAGIALAGAVCLCLGAAVLPWWSGDEAGAAVRIDLGGMQLCVEGRCRTAGLDQFGLGTWTRMAVAARVGGIAVAALAALVALAALAGRRSTAACRAAGLLALFVGILGVLVVALGPEVAAAPDFGIASYLAGSALVAAAITVLPRTR